ncbi:MAG: thioredoxin fold domain-containing protein [Bacteroidota bacterium]
MPAKSSLALCLSLALLLLCLKAKSQTREEVNWLSFAQLDDSLNVQPKKVFIDFYTSWCVYCRKMDQVVFTKPEVVDVLNKEYFSVRMDAETTDTIYFEGQPFVNLQAGQKRNAIHQLAELLGQRNGQFAPPTLVILDAEFNVQQRYFEYMDSGKLLQALRK